jgi:hypothetical protein
MRVLIALLLTCFAVARLWRGTRDGNHRTMIVA